MSWLHAVLLALAGVQAAWAEVLDGPCFELGKQWSWEPRETFLCDRTGRHISINKLCKSHLSSASGRLIIDSSKDDAPTETKKQSGHFPELCLPGGRSYALQPPWLCTCVLYKGRHRWECVVPEGGPGRGMEGGGSGGNRVKRSPDHDPQSALHSTPGPGSADAEVADARADARNASVSVSAMPAGNMQGRIASLVTSAQGMANSTSTASPEVHDEVHSHNGTVQGRQVTPTKPTITVDICDEFGYIHSVGSLMKECACDKDVIATKMFSFKDNNELYHSNSLFAAYECLPGTYSLRCEICHPDTHTCQPVQCP